MFQQREPEDFEQFMRGEKGGGKGGGDVKSVREKRREGKWPHPVQNSALLGTRIAGI